MLSRKDIAQIYEISCRVENNTGLEYSLAVIIKIKDSTKNLVIPICGYITFQAWTTKIILEHCIIGIKDTLDGIYKISVINTYTMYIYEFQMTG